MTSFDARLRILSEPGMPLGVEIDLTNDRMVITSGGESIGDWPMGQIEVVAHSDGFHLMAEGEEVVLNVTDDARFKRELGI